jgi:hypothetical protein
VPEGIVARTSAGEPGGVAALRGSVATWFRISEINWSQTAASAERTDSVATWSRFPRRSCNRVRGARGVRRAGRPPSSPAAVSAPPHPSHPNCALRAGAARTAPRTRVGRRGRGASTAPVRGMVRPSVRRSAPAWRGRSAAAWARSFCAGVGEGRRGSLCAGVIDARGDFALSVTENPPQTSATARRPALWREFAAASEANSRRSAAVLDRELTSPAELNSRQSSGSRAAPQLCGAPVALFETKSPRSAGGSRTPAFPLPLTSRSTRLHPRPRARHATAS